jgi:cytochrome c
MRAKCLLIAALVIVSPVAVQGEQGDREAAKGKAMFATCAACHGAEGEGTDLAPDLHAIVGRLAATQAGFAYSAALRRSGKTWTVDELERYLIDPQAAVPGTRMSYPGAGSAGNAAALVAYLQTLG